jgi:UDP-N-acetylglucosamine:LPS N-acetylglucosamine transferase
MSGRRTKLALVSSHGGHLTELLELAPAFEDCDVFYFCYDADTTRDLPNAYLTANRPYDPIHFVRNLLRLWRIFRRERPDALISTGAEIAIPAFIVAKSLRVPAIYIECGAQVTHPSNTGRVLVNLADRFYVQWPELVAAYGGRAAYRGSLVDETPAAGSPKAVITQRNTGT